jgi:hypothetical protein
LIGVADVTTPCRSKSGDMPTIFAASANRIAAWSRDCAAE